MSYIQTNHGSGGKDFDNLLKDIILPILGNPILDQACDGAILPPINGRLVMATDSHVVTPRKFPGGSLGKLSFCGTVNDLAMMGAKPLYLTLGMIIEEGLSLDELKFQLEEIGNLSNEYDIPIVAGDTKVVERGACDGLYFTTTGLGVIQSKEISPSAESIEAGDVIIINGSIGDHGVSILSAREKLNFQSSVISDCAPLHELTQEIWQHCPNIKLMRDPTRGGVAAVLNELCSESSKTSPKEFEIYEEKLPVKKAVSSICEMMGLDPLELANEGKFIVIAKQQDSEKILEVMRRHPLGRDAMIIGKVQQGQRSLVKCRTLLGGTRLVAWPIGDQFPRIC